MLSTSRRALSFLSVVVLLAAAHCGGKQLGTGGEGGGDGGGGGSAGSGGSGGVGGSGGSGGSPGSNCPESNGMGPAEVQRGAACDWGGSCFVAIPAGCTPGSTADVECDCVGGVIDCPGTVPQCPAESCPSPAMVGLGGSCDSSGAICPAAIMVSGCGGTATVHETCTCDGTWKCPVISPPPCPPPSGPCAAGGACEPPGSSCTAAGEGVCGGDRVFSCQPGGTYDNGTDPCTAGQSCVLPTTHCVSSETCFCFTDGTSSAGHFTCSGCFDAG